MKPHRALSHARPTRRVALRLGLGCAAAAALARRAAAGAAGDGDPGGTLVVLQLTGGNDGLSTLVPYADDAYHAARPTLARRHGEVLPLDERVGLHPALRSLRALYDAGRLAVVEGVGYARPTRSHFRSLDVWHAGDRDGRNVGEGWLGRLAARLGDEPDPLRVVHVGRRVPFAVHSPAHPAAGFLAPDVYRWVEHGQVLGGEAVSEGEQGDDVLAELRRTARAAQASSEAVRAAVARHRPGVEYPDGALARELRIGAALVHAGVGTRVLSLELNGFDHHNDLRARHDRLMGTLDAALGAFVRDLASSTAGRRTAVLVFSEFGRRVAENGSRGTDHGKAGVAFVLGPAARGGLRGAPPSLAELADGDLAHTTDFRSVYAGVARGLFGARVATLFPSDVPALDLVDLAV